MNCILKDTGFKVRWCHCGVYNEMNDSIFIFGGQSFGRYSTFKFHYDLYQILLNGGRVKSVIQNGCVPNECVGQSAILYNDKIYIFGGSSKAGEDIVISKDCFYEFDIKKSKWRIIESKGCPQLAYHSCVLYKDSLYIFGGFDGNTQTEVNYLYQYDLKKQEWIKNLEDTGEAPSKRAKHSAVVYKDTMLIFGGKYKNTSKGDLYQLDFSDMSWEKIKPIGDLPDPREGHEAVVIDNSMYIIGGRQATKQISFRDVFKYNIEQEIWTKLIIWGVDTSIVRDSFTAFVRKDAIIVYGGTEVGNEIVQLNVSENKKKLKNTEFIDFEVRIEEDSSTK